ncbi:hypothetical protein EV424DRAFT_1607636 [Suillus variegatus]|nr:hypothetical protein EV424DRAFT_1607636 [Suillus variegatus]
MCTCTPINVGVAADLEANFTSLTPQTRNTDGDLQHLRYCNTRKKLWKRVPVDGNEVLGGQGYDFAELTEYYPSDCASSIFVATDSDQVYRVRTPWRLIKALTRHIERSCDKQAITSGRGTQFSEVLALPPTDKNRNIGKREEVLALTLCSEIDGDRYHGSAFAAKSAKLREPIAFILEPKLDFYPNGQVRVPSTCNLHASFVCQPSTKPSKNGKVQGCNS